MDNKLAVIFSLLAVVLAAGCTSSNNSNVHGGYPGAIITDFSPIAPSIKAGTPINFYLTVQNFGYSDATNANVILFNCGPIKTGASSGLGAGAYNCNKPLFSKNFGLKKPDANLGIAGESKEADITLNTKPTDFPQGRTAQTFTARLTYDYLTTATRDVFFTTFENWKEKGGTVQIPALNMESNPAPLSLVINVPQPPILINGDPATTQEDFTVGLSIRNAGDGFVEDKNLNEIKLCYDPTFVNVSDKGDFEKDDTAAHCLIISKTSDNAKLIGLTNQYKDVDARFKTGRGAIAVQDVATFDASASYTYSLDRTAAVDVLNG